MKRSPTPYLLAILALSVLLRVGVAIYLGDVPNSPPLLVDQVSYSLLGARVAQGHGFSFPVDWYPFTPADTHTAHWSFLYALFIAGVYTVFGPHPLAVRIIQGVAGGILLPWLVYRLARAVNGAGCGVRGAGGVRSARCEVRGEDSEPDSGSRTSDSGLRTSDFELQWPRIVPLLAALISAVYLYFVLYAATLMTETFFICAVLWSLERALALDAWLGNAAHSAPRTSHSSTRTSHSSDRTSHLAPRTPTSPPADSPEDARERWVIVLGLGVSLGVATLLRQSILPWAAVLLAYLVFRGWRAGRLRAAVGGAAVVGVVIAAFIAPFTLLNYRAYGQFLLLNSNAGFAMYSAQHPMHGTNFQEFEAAPLPDGMLGRPEPELDRELMRMGIQFVLDDPGRYLLLSLSRVRAYFEFWPTPDTSLINNIGRTGSFGVFLPFMLFGLILALRRPGFVRRNALILLFIAFYTVMHIFTWAMVRYRLPVDAVLVVFAAVGAAELWRVGTRRVAALRVAR